jgi:hypothetical protein
MHPCIDRRVAATRGRGIGFAEECLGPRVEFGLGDAAVGDEMAGDAAEPSLIVAELEVIERVHCLRARAEVRPGPDGPEDARRLRQVEMGAERHHRDMDAEDTRLPGLDEDSGLEIDRAEAFKTADIVLQFHDVGFGLRLAEKQRSGSPEEPDCCVSMVTDDTDIAAAEAEGQCQVDIHDDSPEFFTVAGWALTPLRRREQRRPRQGSG